MATPERTVLLTVLAAGRVPYWREQTTLPDGDGNPDFTLAPASAADGVYLEDALVLHTAVQLRANVHRRTCTVHATNYVAGETYTITIGGNAVAVVGGASWAACIIQLIAALPGVPAAAALVTFTAQDSEGNGVNDTLLIEGKAEPSYQLIINSSGLARLHAVCDPISCDMRLYFHHGISPGTAAASHPYLSTDTTEGPSAWMQSGDGNITGLTYRGRAGAFPCAGYDRAYVELYTVAGVAGDVATVGTLVYVSTPLTHGFEGVRAGARVFMGPCVDEPE